MPDLDLAKLREIANAATQGDWTADIHNTRRRSPRTRRLLQWKPEHGTHGYVSVVESDGAYGVLDGPDALHVATFDPPTVLALIAEVERLRGVIEHANTAHSTGKCGSLSGCHLPPTATAAA